MKKFLSVLLAVMMVLSTVSFAIPSAVDTVDTAVEMPVVEEVATLEEADLASDTEWDNPAFGTLVAEVNFDNLTADSDLTSLKGVANASTTVTALGGKLNPAFEASAEGAYFFDTSGTDRYSNMEVVTDDEHGTYFKATVSNSTKTAFDFRTGGSSQFVSEDGYLAVTMDVKGSKDNMLDFHFNRSHNAEDVIKVASKETETKAGEWVQVVSRYDADSIGTSTHNPPISDVTEINHILFYTKSTVEGDTLEFDNWRVYYYPKTVSYTVDLSAYGLADVEITDVDTMTGMTLEEVTALLPAIEDRVFVGFAATEDGEAFGTNVYVDGATVYPVYEERVILDGSLEFTNASDVTLGSLRSGSNNSLGSAFVSHDAENGYLVATYEATDSTKIIQDTGLNFTNKITFPEGVLTNIEFKVRFTGMPEADTTLNQATGGTHNYKVNAVQWPEIYYTTGGTFIFGDDFTCAVTNDEWMTINYTAEELGITDLSTFRFDFYNFMPDGSTFEIDYIRFIGKPVRVTVDNGDNLTAPEVEMDLKPTTTVAEVEAKYAKDHGDMKFVGLSRTEGGEVLASSELVSADGTSTTLYAIWDNYEYLTKYSVNFDDASDISKVRVVQNNAGSQSYEISEDGYLTLKAVPVDGYTGTWDNQVYVETFSPDTALPAGVVSEIAVRMRYRNIPTEKTTYTVQNRTDTAFNPVSNAAFVHICKYGATKWGEQLQSKNRTESNLVDGEWFTRYLDAETYFAGGLSYVRIDTAYPMPGGAEVDIDYIRFVGDNENENIPGAEFKGEYGERIFTVDFDDATTGTFTNSAISALGAEINDWLAPTTSINLTASSGMTSKIEEKADATDKYLTYEYTTAGSGNHAFFGASSFSKDDGYFVMTFDYKTTASAAYPFTFRMNERNLVEDVAEHAVTTDNGEWKKAVLYYDVELGTGTNKSGEVITSLPEISIIKWHGVSGCNVGDTVSMDNITLWYVPKTVTVTVDLSAYGEDNVVIKDYPTTGMDVVALEKLLPAVADRELTGLSLTNGGEAVYENRVYGDTTLYPVYEKVNILDGSYEFNSEADIARVLGTEARLGKNNAKTDKAEQFVLASDNTASYLHVDIEAADGEGGAVVDFGFVFDKKNFAASDVKEMVIKLRVNNVPTSTASYTCGTHCTTGSHSVTGASNFNYMELVYWDADSSAVKQDYIRANLTNLDGEWFTYTISGEDMYYDNILQLRLDPFGDFAPHGASLDIDYIRFYGEPEPDAVALKWSADFDTSAAGVSLNSWMLEDGTYMFDDGVNGDKGPGIGSAYLTDGAPGYITWNEDGYVTLNFDANDEVKAAAEAEGKLAAVYDPSVYVASLDKSAYIPAGSFEEVKIRMRLRGLPADGTEIYGQNYGGLTSATFNMTTYPVYFHWSNDTTAVKYSGLQSSKLDDTCTFTEGSYVADEWFEVTIPASFFDADVEDLATLRINLPDWTPDGTKIDIDYIKFMGKAPKAEAPVSNDTAEFRSATATKANAVRFKASATSGTADAASDIGWVIGRAENLETLGVAYADLTIETAALEGAKVVTGYNREAGVDATTWFDSSDDNALVFAAALTGVPAQYALETLIAKPFVKAGDEYFYGGVIETSLYAVAVEPYINWISEEYADIYEVVEDGSLTYDDCIDYDFEYNDAYYELTEDQQAYIAEVLTGLIG